MRRPRVIGGALLVCGALIGAIVQTPTAHAAGTIVSATDNGVITGKPANITARDVAASAKIGTTDVWVFGDTLYTPSVPPANSAAAGRSSTSATSRLTVAGALTEREDSTETPYQLIPFNAAESAYNVANASTGARWALWPGTIVSNTSSQALIPYLKTNVQPGFLNYQDAGVGIATISSTAKTAKRNYTYNPDGLIFTSSDPHLFGDAGAVISGKVLYMYNCNGAVNPDFTRACYVARVSAQTTVAGKTVTDWTRVNNRSLYEVWNGTTWISQATGGAGWLSQAAPIANGASASFDVAYNAALKKYVAVYLPNFTTNVMMTTAPSPQGPWSAPVVLFQAQQSPCTNCYIYNARQHAEFSTTNATSTTLLITYSRPTGTWTEENRMEKVTLSLS